MDEEFYIVAKSHGSGLSPWNFRKLGENVIIENGVLIFHPENISIGDNVYIGHNTILKGYYINELLIGSGAWIGQQCFLHAGGGLTIGNSVGVGPGVKIITSSHSLHLSSDLPIMHRPLRFSAVIIGDGCDLGVNSVILPGVNLGINVQVGAGAVVTKSFPSHTVVGGVPARVLGESR
ncbi:MAG: acyltransferase [Planctomycetota bacterium]|jgi:acetyltransferase-like isoleucine patch superfamily enzyme